jgi:hypothetical protein
LIGAAPERILHPQYDKAEPTMRTFLIAATVLTGVTLAGLALAAEPPAPKASAKPEARKETRSDPCEAETPKKAGKKTEQKGNDKTKK